jgi:hypothetical protein
MAKELTVDQHNAKVRADVVKLEDKIKELNLTYKSESDKKQASLADCNAQFNKRGKKA